jgi:hypothetical protein
MADEIVHEFGLDMITAYLALPIVKQVLANGTDATLIYIVYSVIKNQFRQIRKGGYIELQHIHMGIFVLMLLFALGDAGLYSYAQVYTISDYAEESNAITISNWYRNIHLSYIIAYCAVILEMFACAVFIFQRSSLLPKQIRVSSAYKMEKRLYSTDYYCLNSQVPKFLTFIVMPFLVIRSISNLALTLIYVYLAHSEQKSTGVITAVLLGLTSVFSYTGLVMIGLGPETDWIMGVDPHGIVKVIFDIIAKCFSPGPS